MNTGIVYKNLGDYSNSFVYYQKALTHFMKINEPNKIRFIQIYINLGQLHEYVSAYSRALTYYNTALQLSREINRSDLEVIVLNNLGGVYKNKMDLDKALDSYYQALELEQDKNNFWKKAVILNNIGTIYSKIGKYKEAINIYKQSLKNRQQTDDRRGEGITKKNIGNFFYLKGYYAQALNYYRKALTLIVKESVESVEIIGEMGICYYTLKQYDKAHIYLKKSIEMTEMFRKRLKYEKHKTGFMQHKRRIYNTIVELLYTLQQEIPGKKYGYSAFEYSEKTKYRTLLDLLEENRIQIKKEIAPDIAIRIKEIEREYNSKNSRLQEELKKPEGEEDRNLLKNLSKDLKYLENEYEDVLIQATIENPCYEHLVHTQQISPAQIQQNLLDASTLLLSYQITENALFTWKISKDSYLFLRHPLKQKELEEKVLYLYQLLSKPAKDDEYLKVASELHALLIKPVLPPGSQYNKLIIIPDRVLHYLPFEVLVSKEKGNPDYLVREYSIQYVQSATILSYLFERERTSPHNNSTDEEGLLAVGDPVLYTDAVKTADSRFPADTLFSLPKLKPIPFSGMEVREIGKLFPYKLILCGRDALEERIKQQDALANYSYIHFATHSIINEENPRVSGLVLTQDNDPREDGFLQVWEIFNLKTRANLVVLSACNTKLGEYIEGEGIIDLTRTWMSAGASAVIASLWGIHDESTSVFMSAFYRNVKVELSYASALRQTRLQTMEQDKYKHPYFWAGFVLTGKDRKSLVM